MLATIPVTIGDAIEVPDKTCVLSWLRASTLLTYAPLANMSTHSPQLEAVTESV